MWNQNATAAASAVLTVGFVAPAVANATAGFGVAGPVGMGLVGLAGLIGGTKIDGHMGAVVTGAGAGLMVGAALSFVAAPAQ